MEKVLLAYATTSGSTQEIAEFVAKELTGRDLQVDLRPCREVADLADYNAVVLGAPQYMFHLHKDAIHFLKRHQKKLVALPVAIFAGGPFGPDAQNGAVTVRKSLDEELAKLSWLRPMSIHLVGGRFDPNRLRFPYNLIPALKQTPASDNRDWAEIRSWALDLPGLLSISDQPAVIDRSQA